MKAFGSRLRSQAIEAQAVELRQEKGSFGGGGSPLEARITGGWFCPVWRGVASGVQSQRGVFRWDGGSFRCNV